MPYDVSLLVGMNGPRGGGKTLLMSYYGAKALWLGYQVWANYKIEFKRNGKSYRALPLDMNALLTFSDELQGGFILIDEIQYFADSLRSTSNANKLLDSFIMQIRKRSLNLLYTAKFFDWVDKRIRFETDVLIDCRDAHFSPWGKDTGKRKGEIFFLGFKDMSGVMTGFPYRERPHIYPTTFNGKAIWPLYDSNEIIDVFEAMAPIKMNLSSREISNKENHDDLVNQWGDTIHNEVENMLTGDRRYLPFAELWGRLGINKNPDKTAIKELLAKSGYEFGSPGGIQSIKNPKRVRVPSNKR